MTKSTSDFVCIRAVVVVVVVAVVDFDERATEVESKGESFL